TLRTGRATRSCSCRRGPRRARPRAAAPRRRPPCRRCHRCRRRRRPRRPAASPERAVERPRRAADTTNRATPAARGRRRHARASHRARGAERRPVRARCGVQRVVGLDQPCAERDFRRRGRRQANGGLPRPDELRDLAGRVPDAGLRLDVPGGRAGVQRLRVVLAAGAVLERRDGGRPAVLVTDGTDGTDSAHSINQPNLASCAYTGQSTADSSMPLMTSTEGSAANLGSRNYVTPVVNSTNCGATTTVGCPVKPVQTVLGPDNQLYTVYTY